MRCVVGIRGTHGNFAASRWVWSRKQVRCVTTGGQAWDVRHGSQVGRFPAVPA